jgi:hypothetical protein
VETPADKKKREAKAAGLGDERDPDLAYFDGSDEEMLQTA